VPWAELACGREGDDGDVMVAQPVRPALRLMAGWAAFMAASCCPRVTWRFAPLYASVSMLVSCVRAHTLCRARRRLVMRGGDGFL
jgi:hypothetical protein